MVLSPSSPFLFSILYDQKTLLARATAQSLRSAATPTTDRIGETNGGAFISLHASDIARSTVGSSEKLVVSIFEMARKNAPSVVFIDEFQALFTNRDGGGSSRLAATLLQCMDDITRWGQSDIAVGEDAPNVPNTLTTKEFESGSCNRVVVLAATNAPWMVDGSFLRRGRFDRIVHVGLPTQSERESILRAHVGKMKLTSNGNICASNDRVKDGVDDEIEIDDSADVVISTHQILVDLICKNLAKSCVGFSGADLASVCRCAAVRCLTETCRGETLGVQKRHFIEAVRYDVTRSINPELADRLHKWRP